MKISPHLESFCLMELTPPRIFLENRGTSTSPGMMPMVMTQAMAEKACGSVMRLARSSPSAVAVVAAAVVS